MNRPGQVAGIPPVKRPRQAAPTVFFGIVLSSWWLFLSAGAVLPTLPAFISSHLGDGSLGIGWAYFLYSAASTAPRRSPFGPGQAGTPHAAGHGQ